MESVAVVITEICKHLPGKHDQQSHAGNRATHKEYMENEKQLDAAKGSLSAAKSDYDRAYKEMYKPDISDARKNSLRAKMDWASSEQRRFEKEVEALKVRQKQLVKSGEYTHPEFGKFSLKPGKEGESYRTYISPSGDEIEINNFGGWSRQRVAARSVVRSAGGEKVFTGNEARRRASDFLKEVFGIGA